MTAQPEAPTGGMLADLVANALDSDYRAAAQRRAARAPRSRSVRIATVVCVLVVFGGMIGVSALRTARNRPVTEAERAQLVAEIHARQARLDSLHSRLADLEQSVAGLQRAATDQRSAVAQVAGAVQLLGGVTGTGPVEGPGVEIVASNAPGADAGESGGTILDTDLQALVNGLWTAGAEAIAINGHRLTALTAIRSAGSAITVNYTSLTPPYVIDAIGDPQSLPAALLATAGGQAWAALHRNFGIGFRTTTKSSIALAGDATATLHVAREAGER